MDIERANYLKKNSGNNIIEYLKKKLEDAKNNNNSTERTEIQEQIWMLKDYQAGYRQNLDMKKVEEIYQSLPDHLFGITKKGDDKSDREKKLRNLQKKLEQIQNLIDRQAKGEKLESNQLEKIKKIDEIKEEIENLK